jgi:tetratricopeptide (TPR) repeat protein
MLNTVDLDSYRYFSLFIRNFSGQNYLASAYQRMAWIALLKGDTAGYRQEMRKILKTPPAKVDEDKQAFLEATSGFVPNPVLLKARLLCDGGFFDRALNELLSRPLHSVLHTHRDLIEYEYRIARIYHEKGENQKALIHYSKTIQLGKEQPYYYAASAALQMGMIYENQQERVLADSAYRICLSINSPEYKASLHLKARAGLDRLKSR